MSSFDKISTEILLIIFAHLNIKDLCRLKQTCKRLNQIITAWAHLFVDKDILVTNQVNAVMCNRSSTILQPFEKVRISRNWVMGCYKERSLLKKYNINVPWLHLDDKLLWVSQDNTVRAYHRNENGFNVKNFKHKITSRTSGDIVRFVVKNDILLCGQSYGSMFMWSIREGKFIFNIPNAHSCDVQDVDMRADIIATGSRNGVIKIWKIRDEITAEASFTNFNRIWSLAINPERNVLVAGQSEGPKSLLIYDMSNFNVLAAFGSTYGSPIACNCGILAVKWENCHVLWFTGYDGHLYRWDLRQPKWQRLLSDPYSAAIYCFEFDHNNTIIGGTQYDGRALLWDTRQTKYVNMYYMKSCRPKIRSSPIYSLSFDAKYLFAATDRHVSVLDFSATGQEAKDYKPF